MANDTNIWQVTARRRPADEDICPLVYKSPKTDGEAAIFRLDRTSSTGSCSVDRQNEERGGATTCESSEDELGRLDIDLDRKSKQHNLSSRNVRAILHEVITHEHVVAMMKAAIRATQDLPMFEPKMTRSRLKQAAQQGQKLSWGLSAANAPKTPQFVDIDLEEDEDSSDEEYCPDEQEEDDTADETLPSDADSLSSPPRMHQRSQNNLTENQQIDEALQKSVVHAREEVMTSTPQHLLTAPESSFLERLNAVEEELDCSPSYTYSQCLEGKTDDDDGGDEGPSCLAYRTRSKHPLVNVPLGQLEAELLAPDITADMYEQSAAQQEEDRHWTMWLQGLVAPDNEEEAEDDDDPEYNFLDDLDEPDLEDYRTDRAVQITKKEVNELLDELFDTLQEEEPEEQETSSQTGPKFNVPIALRFEAPLADMLTERRRTVRKRYEALQQRRALQDTTNQHRASTPNKDTPILQPGAITSVLVLPSPLALHLDSAQKLQLQQQVQQHVQLLTQVHLLCRHVEVLNHEACMTKHYLEELQNFARRQEELFLSTSFRTCNLQGALDLLEEVEQVTAPPPAPRAAAATSRRWLPRMTPTTNSHAFPLLPVEAAWVFATRPVFLYPELLPVCNLDQRRDHRIIYTPGENGLIVLALKHFEGTLQSEELISSYLLCKTRWSIRKHIREMCSSRAPPNNIVKMYLKQKVTPRLPLACGRVQPGDQRPPVDKNCPNMPNWLKNSQPIIQKTLLDTNRYPPSLPPGCSLRLHPHFLNKCRAPNRSHRRFFTLAHNASLLPLAKAPADSGVDPQSISYQPLSPVDVGKAYIHAGPAQPISADVVQTCLPIGHEFEQQEVSPTPFLSTPILSTLTHPETTNPIMPCESTAVKPGYFLLQMMWTPPAPPAAPLIVSSQHAPGQHIQASVREEQPVSTVQHPPQVKETHGEEAESSASPSTLSPLSSCTGVEEEEEKEGVSGVITMNGGENTGGGEEERREAEGGDVGGGGGGEGEEPGGGEEGEQEGEDEEHREEGGGDREEDGEKDKDEDQDRQGEEEEEEDFDDLTQDEDEEEVMSSASEESVLSVPELQETMKQLTWLAAERRLCTDGDSEEEHSPTSTGSQEEEEEEEEEGPKGEESGARRSSKESRDEETPTGERTPRGGGGRCPGRGRGRSRPLRGLRRSRQERHSKDTAKLLLLYDENILDNDPHRESKDVAFAQSYLNRVREALQDTPERVEDFVSLLHEFEHVGEGQEVTSLFRKLRSILGDRTELLRDFAAFLHPEQALQCGLLEEQQAFERSRRFLRQLEITFGDNPSHYQKIIKALQTGPDLSPTSIHELKAQMETLLKGHTHLQAEFWVFFEELRPPPARPGQFEEAHWPEEAGGGSDGGDGVSHFSIAGATSGFEEVTLPELEEEEDGHKILPMTSRRQGRKMGAHRNYKDCDWSDKDWTCLCRDAKSRRHRRKGCSHCHGNKNSGGVSRAMKSLDPVYSQLGSAHDDPGDPKGESPPPDQSSALWEASFPLTDEKEEEEQEEEEDDDDEEERKKRNRIEEVLPTAAYSSPSVSASNPCTSTTTSTSVTSSSSSASPLDGTPSSAPLPRPSPPLDVPVCAKNISLTASGEKVILWTREADRVILTTCQQEGANQSTFQAISTLLGNKTPNEVSRRFRDLMRLFRTAARQTSSEDEAPPTEPTAANEDDADVN